MGLRLAAALWRFWYTHGFLSEGRAWLAGMLALAATDARARALRAKALNGAGVLAASHGDDARATALLADSVALCRDLGDKGGRAKALGNLGNVARLQGNHRRSAALHRESLALFQEVGDKVGSANALDNLGLAVRCQGDYGRAMAIHQEGLAVFQQMGDKAGSANALSNVGTVAFEQGDLVLQLYLSSCGQFGQPHQTAFVVTPFGDCLVMPPPPRPGPYLSIIRRWRTQQLPQQAPRFRHGYGQQSPRCCLKACRLPIGTAADKKGVSCAWVRARSTTRKACASRASVMWRCQPCHERTSY